MQARENGGHDSNNSFPPLIHFRNATLSFFIRLGEKAVYTLGMWSLSRKTKQLFRYFAAKDKALHVCFVKQFPRAMPLIDGTLDFLFNVFTHAAFSLIVGLLL